MRYRSIPNTTLSVSELGFGTWGIGGNHKGAIGYGPTNDEQSIESLVTAKSHGINFYDTSNLYGYGKSEQLLGIAFSDCRRDVIIASKFGFLDFDGAQDFSTDNMHLSLEQSLTRLNTDYIDVYQLHSPPQKLLKEMGSSLIALKSLKQQGVIKYIGVSLASPNDLVHLTPHLEHIDLIQTNLSLIDQRILETDAFSVLNKHNVGVIARSPLCYGFLTGQYKNQSFHAQDNRSRWSEQQKNLWSEAGGLFKDLYPDRETETSMALNFCLSFSGITSVIPSMITPLQVMDNISAINNGYRPTEKTLQSIYKIYQQNTFFAETKNL